MFNYDRLSVTEATQLQHQMREKLLLKPLENPIRTIAGADISFNRFSTTVYAGIVVLSYPDLKPLTCSLIEAEARFPYVSGYLAFREIPAVTLAWNQLTEKPDIIIMDGHGIAHPRKTGIATHFGILENVPAIGCGKTMLFGKFDDLAAEKFSTSPIYGKGELLGYALRTKDKTNPVYVSPGHLITAEESVEIVKDCVGKYRIPEPTRLAHNLVNAFRRGDLKAGLHFF